jgi:hypothetical protein
MNEVLRINKLAREGRVATQHAPFAEHTLRIPTDHWQALVLLFPGLESKNNDEYAQAMNQLHASPLADPYRVRSRKAQLGHF